MLNLGYIGMDTYMQGMIVKFNEELDELYVHVWLCGCVCMCVCASFNNNSGAFKTAYIIP